MNRKILDEPLSQSDPIAFDFDDCKMARNSLDDFGV